MLTKEAITVLHKRYLKKDDQGEVIETPEEMLKRVAKTVASAERLYGKAEAEALVWEERFFQINVPLPSGADVTQLKPNVSVEAKR